VSWEGRVAVKEGRYGGNKIQKITEMI
jgi:hypothetical protein